MFRGAEPDFVEKRNVFSSVYILFVLPFLLAMLYATLNILIFEVPTPSIGLLTALLFFIK